MVHTCAAYGCTQRYKKGITFHQFPLKQKELLKQWLIAIRRKDFLPSKYSLLCMKHFTENDYIHPVGTLKPLLKPDAVPSIFDFPEHLKRKLQERKPPKKRQFAQSEPSPESSQPLPKSSEPLAELLEPLPESLESRSQKNPRINSEQNSATELANATHDHLYFSSQAESSTTINLRKKVRTLQQKVRRMSKHIATLSSALEQSQNALRTKESAEFLEDKFSGIAKELFRNELKNIHKGVNGRQYSEEIKNFAHILHFYSPRAYDFLRGHFCLPSPCTLSNYPISVSSEHSHFQSNDNEKQIVQEL